MPDERLTEDRLTDRERDDREAWEAAVAAREQGDDRNSQPSQTSDSDNYEDKGYGQMEDEGTGGRGLGRENYRDVIRDQIERGEPPEGSEIETRDAKGEPDRYTYKGETYYGRGSLAFDMGFRTEREYVESQGRTPYGVHEGKDVPEESIIILEEGGKPHMRVAQRELDKSEGLREYIRQPIERGAYRVALKDWEGRERLLRPEQADNLRNASEQDSVRLAIDYGLIPQTTVRRLEAEEPALFRTLVTEGYEAYNKAVQKERARQATSRVVEQQEERKAMGTLEDYKSGDSYRLAEALADGISPATIRAAGFTQEQIDAQGDEVKYLRSSPEEKFGILQGRKVLDKRTGIEIFKELQTTNTNLKDAKFISYDKESGEIIYELPHPEKQLRHGVVSGVDFVNVTEFNKRVEDYVGQEKNFPKGRFPSENSKYVRAEAVVTGQMLNENAKVKIPTAKELGEIGIGLIPGVGTVYYWNRMSTPFKVASVAMDILFLGSAFRVPIASAARGAEASVARITPKAFRTEFMKSAIIASDSGRTSKELTSATRALKSLPSEALATPKGITALTRFEVATRKSISADLKFVDRLSGLDKVDTVDLAKFEKYSAMKGLKKAVINVSKAKAEFETALKKVDSAPTTMKKIENIQVLAKKRDELFKRLDKFNDVVTPRSQQMRVPSPETTTWTQGGAEGTGFYIAEIRDSNLFDDIDGFLKGKPPKDKGKLSPEEYERNYKAMQESWKKEQPYERKVATATKESKISEIKFKPEVKRGEPKSVTMPKEAGIPAKAPKIAKEPSVFPGITPKVRVTTHTETKTLDAEAFGRMTPEKIREIFGDEIQIDAYSTTPLPSVRQEPKGKEWLSPSEAVKQSQRIAVDSYAQSVTKDAADLRSSLANQNVPRSQINMAVKNLVVTQTETIVNQKLKTEVVKKIKQELRTDIRIPVRIPLKLKTPILRIPLPTPSMKRDKEVRRLIKERGATVWPQGELTGGKIWHVVLEPYNEGTHFVLVGKQPEGAKLFPGPKEAYRNIVQVSGRPPQQPVKLEGGAIDPIISSTAGGKVRISFVADKDVKEKKRYSKRFSRARDRVKEVPEIGEGVVESRKRGRHLRLT